MKKISFILTLILGIGLSAFEISGQDRPAPPPPPRPPAPMPTPPRLSEGFAKNLENLPPNFEPSRENRQQAYAKLLEGQRYIWQMRRVRQSFSVQSGARFAKTALKEAIDLDPTLAEAYTALAELALTTPPQDIEEAISLSKIATRLDRDNFGGHVLLARLYTVNSNLGRGKIHAKFSDLAIKEWLEITRLESRNAEAWAILSNFYSEKADTESQIRSLRNWLASSTPLDVGFYSSIMIREGELSNENASLKLGEALLEIGNHQEALTVLTRAVSDSPDNLDAVEFLGQALENFEGSALIPATEALRQAVYANPDNISLNMLLAETISRSGNIKDATKFLKDAIEKYVLIDKNIASSFQVSLGDIYAESKQTDDAIKSYQDALNIRGISSEELATDEERDFAMLVVNKMIDTYKMANRFDDAKNIVNTYKTLFGANDTTLERGFINVLRDSGKREDALETIRAIRQKNSLDYSLIRTEALILTELGKVDEGVALIQELIDKKPENVAPSVKYIDYNNYLFITSLYLQANKPDDAITVAHKAVDIAKDKEEKQIANLTLASAIQSAGNFEAAEDILNEILTESPNNPIALNNLGYLFLESGKNYELALNLINKAILIDPRNPQYLDSLGWAYFKLKKFDEAEKHLTKAIKYDSSSSTIFEHLGDVYKQKNMMDKAQENWKKALDLSSNTKDKTRIETKLTK